MLNTSKTIWRKRKKREKERENLFENSIVDVQTIWRIRLNKERLKKQKQNTTPNEGVCDKVSTDDFSASISFKTVLLNLCLLSSHF